jgi:hypothetical protein
MRDSFDERVPAFPDRASRLARSANTLGVESERRGGRVGFDESAALRSQFRDPDVNVSINFGLHRGTNSTSYTYVGCAPLNRLSRNDFQRIVRTRRHTQVDSYNATTPQPKDTSDVIEIAYYLRPERVPYIPHSAHHPSWQTGKRVSARRCKFLEGTCAAPIGRVRLLRVVGGLIVMHPAGPTSNDHLHRREPAPGRHWRTSRVRSAGPWPAGSVR